MTGIEIAIQVLTCSALVGLLGAVGMRLTYAEVKAALSRCRFIAILLLNFFVVPLFAVAVADLFGLEHNVTIGMVLLAAAPFAPVVPVFARMARADLALAAALTGVFPLVSAVLTPFAAQTALRFFARADVSNFGIWRSLAILMATTTLPLAIGVLVRHQAPKLGERLLRPVESDVRGCRCRLARVCYRNSVRFGRQPRMALLAGDGANQRRLAFSRLAPRWTRSQQPPGHRARHQQSEYCPRFARGHSKLSH